ncbi:hypothetical protein L2E82_16894 [Cichorium intybus]|uniref:Uncharacterized protein n=1 Tax=Cichorium intybus TaxID=13427 RepID=A0ACB9F7G2_CICIN|nr:hypothetical protein L2E82_16894 [Cichorium intybus]
MYAINTACIDITLGLYRHYYPLIPPSPTTIYANIVTGLYYKIGVVLHGDGRYSVVRNGAPLLCTHVSWVDFEISTNRLRSRSIASSYLKMSNNTIDVPKTRFSFYLCRRNNMLTKKGLKSPSYLKTGTTIVGLILKNGVILGAYTRATEGPIVADKNCEKIHYMAPNIYCCGAGTAADTEAVTDNESY